MNSIYYRNSDREWKVGDVWTHTNPAEYPVDCEYTTLKISSVLESAAGEDVIRVEYKYKYLSHPMSNGISSILLLFGKKHYYLLKPGTKEKRVSGFGKFMRKLDEKE